MPARILSAVLSACLAFLIGVPLAAIVVSQEASFARASPGSPHVVFLVSNESDENSYEAAKTIPRFAETLGQQHGFRTTVLKAEGQPSASRIPNLEALARADLLVVFCRRLGLQPEQLTTIRNHLAAGKPIVGIRTANHAFSARGEIPPGYAAWWEFVADVLGAENRGYAPAESVTTVSIVKAAAGHAILTGVPAAWQSKGNLYFTAPLIDKEATVLLVGAVGDRTEPIAWTRMADKSRVFYTSLGHPTDFQVPHFQTLLVNGIRWALGQE